MEFAQRMKLIVGLGNPGKKYERTRHNVGFDVLRTLASAYASAGDTGKDKFDGHLVEAVIAEQRAMLLWPMTLMNRSGQSVAAAMKFYQTPLANLLVVCDDFNLPLGALRFRRQGSAGGQRGLQDIIQRLGSDDFSRLRIGIGPVPTAWDAADFVLSRFARDERPLVDDAIERATQGVKCWVASGIEASMNQFNAGC